MGDGGIIVLWIGGLVLAGIVGFVVMALVLAGKLVGLLFRSLVGGPAEAASGRRASRARDAGSVVCPQRRCAHVNAWNARFCARCGRPLRRAYDTDLYG